jgi:hypothetical protein
MKPQPLGETELRAEVERLTAVLLRLEKMCVEDPLLRFHQIHIEIRRAL